MDEQVPLTSPRGTNGKIVASSDDARKASWWYVFRVVGFSSLVAVLLGYDIGVMSGAILDIEITLSLTMVQKELVVGLLNFVSAFGALLAGAISDRFG